MSKRGAKGRLALRRRRNARRVARQLKQGRLWKAPIWGLVDVRRSSLWSSPRQLLARAERTAGAYCGGPGGRRRRRAGRCGPRKERVGPLLLDPSGSLRRAPPPSGSGPAGTGYVQGRTRSDRRARPTDLRRNEVLGGLIHEYRLVA